VAKLISLRRGENISNAGGTATRRFIEYIEELTGQINTTTDETGEINVQISQVLRLGGIVADILKKQENVVVTTTSLTARAYDLVICNNSSPIDITTPINPIQGDIFNVKRKDAQVTVLGIIDGVTDKIINVQYWSMKLAYDGTEWSAV